MKAMILSKDCNSSAAMAAAPQRGYVGTVTLRLPDVSVGNGSQGTAFEIRGDQYHGLTKECKVDRMVEGVSGSYRTGARGRAAVIGGDRFHGLAKGSNVDRVVEGVSGFERAGARRRAVGFKIVGTHESTNRFKMTEIGEGGRF